LGFIVLEEMASFHSAYFLTASRT